MMIPAAFALPTKANAAKVEQTRVAFRMATMEEKRTDFIDVKIGEWAAISKNIVAGRGGGAVNKAKITN